MHQPGCDPEPPRNEALLCSCSLTSPFPSGSTNVLGLKQVLVVSSEKPTLAFLVVPLGPVILLLLPQGLLLGALVLNQPSPDISPRISFGVCLLLKYYHSAILDQQIHLFPLFSVGTSSLSFLALKATTHLRPALLRPTA